MQGSCKHLISNIGRFLHFRILCSETQCVSLPDRVQGIGDDEDHDPLLVTNEDQDQGTDTGDIVVDQEVVTKVTMAVLEIRIRREQKNNYCKKIAEVMCNT